jgi:hypothetical protein
LPDDRLPTDYRHHDHYIHLEEVPASDTSTLFCRDVMGRRVRFSFRHFTGHERQPFPPARADEDDLRWALLGAEYDVAVHLWQAAQFYALFDRAATNRNGFAAAVDRVRAVVTSRDLWETGFFARLQAATTDAITAGQAWQDVSSDIADRVRRGDLLNAPRHSRHSTDDTTKG